LNELVLHGWLVGLVFVGAAAAALALQFLSAPYGRHVRAGWGPTVPNRIGWILMEMPTVVVFCAVYAQGEHAWEAVPLVLLGLWQVHYVHRTFIFPFRLRKSEKRFPLSVAFLAILFNTVNAYVNARWISHFGVYAPEWFADPRFVVGTGLFLVGEAINHHADWVLLHLRAPGETGYKIPTGGLYRWITCPNYFGELVAWTGWAIAAWSVAGVSFAVFTAANLVPRAFQNHAWYREKFDDYPKERKVIVPFLL